MAFAAAALPYIAAAAAVAGTAVSAVGAMEQGQQAAAAQRYNAQVEAERAAAATSAAQSNAAIVQQDTRRKMGEAEAAFGAGGVDLTGSPLSVMSDLAGQGELSRQITLYQGKMQALSDTSQGGLDTAGASASASAGLMRAGGTLLTGVTNAGKSLLPYLSGPSGGSVTTTMPGQSPIIGNGYT